MWSLIGSSSGKVGAAVAGRQQALLLCARAMGSSRAKRGLYGGKDVRFGNNISHSERRCVEFVYCDVFLCCCVYGIAFFGKKSQWG